MNLLANGNGKPTESLQVRDDQAALMAEVIRGQKAAIGVMLWLSTGREKYFFLLETQTF